MKEFVLPFKPEELLAQPADPDRLWASSQPDVDCWSEDEAKAALDGICSRLLTTQGRDVAGDETFCLLFAVLQAWTRLEENVHARVSDLLTDAGSRLVAYAAQLKKIDKASKNKEDAEQLNELREVRTAAKVAVFFMHWAVQRALKVPEVEGGRRRGKGKKEGDEDAEAAKEKQKAIDRQRCGLLQTLADIINKGAMPWLWLGDTNAWQSVAEKVSDAGFLVPDEEKVLKHRETKQIALKCVADPLNQEGHQQSTLLVATVSKLTHTLRGTAEGVALFVADAILLAHATPLPRLLLVELAQQCSAGELTSQGGFQRALGAFLTALAERLPHVVLANISVLLPLLDVDCYPLRSAVIESIGHVLNQEGRQLPKGTRGLKTEAAAQGPANGDDAAVAADGAADGGADASALIQVEGGRFGLASSTKMDLLDTIATRSTDKTVWVRVRTLQTMNSLAGNRKVVAMPLDMWPRALEIACKRMQDSASSARKSAMGLVRTLIQYHPYGPALKGTGDERAKVEKMMVQIMARMQKLNEEEATEIEQEEAAKMKAQAMEDEDECAGAIVPQEQEPKRRRLGKKTNREETCEAYEVEKVLNEVQADNDGGDKAAERERQRQALVKMRDCYTQRFQFMELVDRAEARLRGLLGSRVASDVIEAIGVVVELKLRGLPAANRAFNQVLGLVWSRTPNIKDAATEAFHRMHLEGRSTPEAVESLLEMYQVGCTSGGWTYTHLASVQELIQQAAQQDMINPKQAISTLLGALQGPSTVMVLRCFSAIASACVKDIAAALPKFIELFGPEGQLFCTNVPAAERLERAYMLCGLLRRVHGCMNQVDAKDRPQVLSRLYVLSQRIVQVVVQHFRKADVPSQWFSALQASMDLSFELSDSATPDSDPGLHCPDKLWGKILEKMMSSILKLPAGQSEAPPTPKQGAPPLQDGDAGDAGDAAEGTPEDGMVVTRDVRQSILSLHEEPAEPEPVMQAEVQPTHVACIAYLAGHFALRMVIFMESIQGLLKKKRIAEEDQKMAEAREKKKMENQKKKKGKKEEEKEEPNAAEAMGMARQEEREADLFTELTENGLLYSSGKVLSQLRKFVKNGLIDVTQREDPVMRRAAAISLCKFMTVSKRFCEANLDLLFGVLFPKARSAGTAILSASAAEAESAAQDMSTQSTGAASALLEDLTLRQGLLVAVGDLLFRHPNVVEPWSDRLYAALGVVQTDGAAGTAAAELRLTALLVLTHLVLNDMMKPRAILLVRALWLTACPHEATARVSRILFQELSKRANNVVYNLLPEIISRLPAEQESFDGQRVQPESRVQWVMQFIEKEKHIEGLIEKLSSRLEKASNAAGGRANVQGTAGPDDMEATAAAGEGEQNAPAPAPEQAVETVNCMAHALGAMNYSDRCILRLHDVIVTRKALNIAIAYHAVVRECLLNIVEKSRKPKVGRAAADAGAPAPENADGAAAPGEKGKDSAAVAAIDAIEQHVNALGKGKKDEEEAPGAEAEAAETADADAGVQALPTPARAGGEKAPRGGGKGKGKRKQEGSAAEVEPGFEEEKEARSGGGRGRGRGGGSAPEAPVKKTASGGDELRAALKAMRGRGRGGAKRQRVAAGNDDEE